MLFIKVTTLVALLASSTTPAVNGFSTTISQSSPSFLREDAATRQQRSQQQHASPVRTTTSMMMMMMDGDDSFLSPLSHFLLADGAAITDAVTTGAGAAAAADTGNGGLGFLTTPIEALLNLIHNLIVAVGVDNAWGYSIILLTVLVKAVTYPLTKQQLESTVKMQAVQPLVKELQAKYQSNPEVMNQKVAEVYKENEVNPLAGCLPAIIQLPVFVGLYRAVFALAKDNALDESFLWLPSLEGPTYGAELGKGNDWLTKALFELAPPLGWESTAAFLTIPIILILTQAVSIELNKQGQTPEQKEQTDNIVFKLLPLFLGWISVGVPSALGIYWISNNLITTLLTLQIKSSLEANPPPAPVAGGGATMAPPTNTATSFIPAPMREKPAGFASSSEMGGVSPITASSSAVDAEIVDVDTPVTTMDGPPLAPQTSTKKRGKKKKRKKN